MGKAQRSDFTKRKLNTPAPGFYSVESQFEKDVKGNRGKTFGISRDVNNIGNYPRTLKIRGTWTRVF